MKYFASLLAFLLCGCGLINGDKVSFGHSFPDETLRDKTFYITNREDYLLVVSLKSEVYETFSSDGWLQTGPNGNATKLRRVLSGYRSDWLGWF
jgi:hypothetical protein